ncbi:helix-turn-helix domain-containing protein [Streptomyces cacaoi]|uniref:helix-turn-helix domain-containing protein n=1 Tax=Streptomyces cacaoi TaxID=1898 RepID=UPI003748F6A0
MVKGQKNQGQLKAPSASPALKEFGEDIREVRLARKMLQKHLAAATGYSEAYVSKVESGLITPARKFVQGCDRTFGTGNLFARQLRMMTEGDHPSWFAPYMDAEREATVVEDFSATFVIGLLQTEAYARAIFAVGWNRLSSAEVDAQVTSRLRRREILERQQPPQVWVILHEACLRVRVGSARVMADQITHILREVERHPNLVVQILPNSVGAAAHMTPFTALTLPGGDEVVYTEGPQGGRPYRTKEAVANARRIIDHLRACALSPHDSAAYLSRVKDDHERDARKDMDQVELQRLRRGAVRRVGPGARVRRGRHPRP